jgi:hypothetical protein
MIFLPREAGEGDRLAMEGVVGLLRSRNTCPSGALLRAAFPGNRSFTPVDG